MTRVTGRRREATSEGEEVPMTDAGGAAGTPVVTLFESYGSGADDVGPRVALALGVPYHEQAFSSRKLEESAELREREGLLARVLGAMANKSFGGLDVGDVSGAQRDSYDLVMQNTATVRGWARQGGVIVGRNGAFILSDWPTALHVKLDGPLEQRIERAAREAGISVDRAARRQKNEDYIRATMSIELYGWDPRDPTRYDLVLNTGRMDLEPCVEIIVQAWRIKIGRMAGRAS
jgi:cytidylate kinase